MSRVYAPVSGIVNPIEQSTDVVFSTKMLGNGVVIAPTNGKVHAPCEGVVSALFPDGHAFVIDTGNMQVMVHIGVDTVKLNGEGFRVVRAVGDRVCMGDLVVEADLDFIASRGYSTEVMVVALEKADIAELYCRLGMAVAVRDELFDPSM